MPHCCRDRCGASSDPRTRKLYAFLSPSVLAAWPLIWRPSTFGGPADCWGAVPCLCDPCSRTVCLVGSAVAPVWGVSFRYGTSARKVGTEDARRVNFPRSEGACRCETLAGMAGDARNLADADNRGPASAETIITVIN